MASLHAKFGFRGAASAPQPTARATSIESPDRIERGRDGAVQDRFCNMGEPACMLWVISLF
jgi:hypothetical protein